MVLNSLRLLVDIHPWRHRLGDWWYDIKRLRWRIATATAALAIVVYLASGLHAIGVGQLGLVQQFGKRVLPLEQPGLHYRLPYPLAWHYVIRPEETHRVEIGFRSGPGESTEPPAYEWNVQHRGGRYLPMPEESYVWTGDENLIDVNLVVHYRVADPEAALFKRGVAEGDLAARWDELVRAESEAAFRAEMTRREADDLLGASRQEIAAAIARKANEALDRCAVGLQVEQVCFGDIHPPLEVVPAFRDVSMAMEEKEARINEAQAYRYQTVATARGQAAGQKFAAEGFCRRSNAAGYGRRRAVPGSGRGLCGGAEGHRIAPLLASDGDRPGRKTESDYRRRARRATRIVSRAQGSRLALEPAAGDPRFTPRYPEVKGTKTHRRRREGRSPDPH